MIGRLRGALAGLALLAGVTACSTIRDIYVGSDVVPAPAPGEPAGAAGAKPADPAGAAGETSADPRSVIRAEQADAAPQGELPNDAGPTLEVDAATPAMGTCSAVQLDCDGDASNGCETDSSLDRAHCGQCGNACTAPDCSCSAGQLVVACASGRGDCDGDARNGCEVDVGTSMQHCGRCQRACHTNGHDAIDAVCVSGHCRITCEAEAFPEGDCDDDPDNGCETPLFMNDQHCGACGVRCTCNMGSCI